MIQNLWNTVKAVLKGKFIVIQAYLRKQEKLHISSLSFHLKEVEKEKQMPQVSRRKEIIKSRNK